MSRGRRVPGPAAVEKVDSLDLLINNAGVALYDDLSDRAVLEQHLRVHAVLTGPTDTDMTRGFEIPKASVESVARAIFDGIENGDEDIFPDPLSASLADSWRHGPAKGLEHQYAALVSAVPIAS